jgi:hypothetical protein
MLLVQFSPRSDDGPEKNLTILTSSLFSTFLRILSNTSKVMTSSVLVLSSAILKYFFAGKLFIFDDKIDNDESEYIFNSILRLCQSYGFTYNDLISLNTSDMVRFLIHYQIILSRENDNIFRALKLEPISDKNYISKSAITFNEKNIELIYKQDNQHMTFYRYVYALVDRYSNKSNEIISTLFSSRKPMGFM